MVSLLDLPSINGMHAELLASHGYTIFPCHAGGAKVKSPMVLWKTSGTADVDVVKTWWKRWPSAAIGLDAAKSGLLIIDADFKHGIDGVSNCREMFREHGIEIDTLPHCFTPNKGLHLYFRQRDGEPLGNATGNLPPGIDVRGAGGLVIAPGTVMEDGRQYQACGNIADAPPAPDWLVDLIKSPKKREFLARSSPPRKQIAAPTNRAEGYAQKALDEELDRVRYAPKGQRNEQLNLSSFALGQLIGGGLLERNSVAGLLENAAQSLTDDDGLGRTLATIRSGINDGTQKARDLPDFDDEQITPEEQLEREEASRRLAAFFDRRDHLKIASANEQSIQEAKSEIEWFDNVQPVIHSPYIVKGLIDAGSMSVVYGPSNSGKTFFALDLAYHVAIDTQWRDRRVKGGGVLYLAAEGGNGIANRIVALKRTHGVLDVPFALRRAGLDLLKPDADVKKVVALANEVQAKCPLTLIVIDTLSRVIAGGDENAASDMTAFIKNVDTIRMATGAHILIVHHTGKDVAKGARGHSSLRAATDTEIELVADEFENRFAKVTKQRDYEGGEEFNFSLKPVHLGQDQDGDAVVTCVVEPVEKETTKANDMPPMATCKAILEDIQTAYNAANPYSMTTQSQRTGRYAPRALGKKFNIKMDSMDRLLKAWIDNEVVMMSSFDKRNGRSGLMVIGGIG